MEFEAIILYEDNHLLALNKPAGMLAQGDRTGDASLIDHAKNYLRTRYNKPGQVFVGLVHRLDRPVSGVVLLAKTSKALSRMNRMFSDQSINKGYWAVTSNLPPSESGTLVHWLKKDGGKNRTKAFGRETPGAKMSELSYTLILTSHGKYLLEIYPRTGRSHQIRAQLNAIGCPILGDVKYGFKGQAGQSIALHARSLNFEHPVKKELLEIEAPLPEVDYWQPFL